MHPHESPPVMTWPMILLAIGSIVEGGFLILNSRLVRFLTPVVPPPLRPDKIVSPYGGAAIGMLVIGFLIAWAMYGRREVPRTVPAGHFPTVAARKDLYGNAFNESIVDAARPMADAAVGVFRQPRR